MFFCAVAQCSGAWGQSALSEPAPVAIDAFQQEIDARDTLGQNLLNQGKYAEAELAFRTNITQLESRRAVDDADLLASRANLGQALLLQGKLDAAIVALESVRATLENARPSDGTMLLTVLNTLGNAYAARGRTDEAEVALQRVLAERQRLFGADDPRTLNALNSLAGLYRMTGRLDDAFRLFSDLVERRRRISGTEDVETLRAESNLGETLMARGEYEASASRLLSVQERAERVHAPAIIIYGALNTLGQLYVAQGRLEAAEPILARAMAAAEASFGVDNPTTLATVTGLANVYALTERYDLAQPLLERALAASEGGLGAEHRNTLAIADSLALVYVHSEQYDAAERLFTATRARRERVLSHDDPDRYQSQHGLSALYIAQRRFADSERELTLLTALYARLLGAENNRTLEALDNLAMVRLLQPQRAALAMEPARSLVAYARRYRAHANTVEGQSRATAARKVQAQWFHYLINAAWARATEHPEEAEALRAEAFLAMQDMMVSNDSRAIAQMAARRSATASDRALEAIARMREELTDRWTSLSAQFNASFETDEPGAPAERVAIERTRNDIEQQLTAIDLRLEREFPAYFALLSPAALTVAQAQQLMATDEAMVVIAPGDLTTFSFAVARDQVRWWRHEQSEEAAQQAVQRIRNSVGARISGTQEQIRLIEADAATRPPNAFNRTTAHSVYRLLVAPGEQVYAGKRRLYVVAGGPLASLPFSLLVTAAPTGADDDPAALRSTAWFGDAYALVHIPSIQALAALRALTPGDQVMISTNTAGTFIGFGDPALQGGMSSRGATRSSGTAPNITSLPTFDNLPGTARELEAMRVALHARRTSLYLGTNATEQRVRTMDLSHAAILAFATHGLVANEIPGVNESGLVLTPPPGPSALDDGYLTASEVAGLRLNADWVILSACNTATSDPGNQGLSSLVRAFFYAGARNLLASHWPVSDDVAPLLTVRTITLQREGIGRAEAFQQAMRSIRMDTRGDALGESWAHPFYWAPFVMIGAAN